jgi:hypothetical protein
MKISKNTLKQLKNAKSKKTVVKRKTIKQRKPIMSAVSTVDTAPVAIGNSVRGFAMQSTRSRNGANVIGRDFMFTPIGTSAIQTWTSTGGTPLTPAAFVDSKIRSYLQLYQKYRWRRCVVHYITSSPTSSTGDVMFYHGKNRDSVFLNQTSSLLLPFVMSDPDSVIGPQWTNHSAELKLQGTWKSCDYGMTDSLNDYADGEVFLLSKTTTTDSPGYVLMDYEIEFSEEQISPRLLSLPLSRIQYNNVNLSVNGAIGFGNVVFLGAATGNNLSGSQSSYPTGTTVGDIFKVILDVTNSVPGSWVNANTTNLFRLNFGQTTAPLTVSDGMTLYGVVGFDNNVRLYANSSSAYTGGDPIEWGVTATIVANLQCWVSYVGSESTINLIPNF